MRKHLKHLAGRLGNLLSLAVLISVLIPFVCKRKVKALIKTIRGEKTGDGKMAEETSIPNTTTPVGDTAMCVTSGGIDISGVRHTESLDFPFDRLFQNEPRFYEAVCAGVSSKESKHTFTLCLFLGDAPIYGPVFADLVERFERPETEYADEELEKHLKLLDSELPRKLQRTVADTYGFGDRR